MSKPAAGDEESNSGTDDPSANTGACSSNEEDGGIETSKVEPATSKKDIAMPSSSPPTSVTSPQQPSPSSVKAFIDAPSESPRRPTSASTQSAAASSSTNPESAKVFKSREQSKQTSTKGTAQDRMKRIMADPAEWSKFRSEMAAGGGVTNASATMELLKRVRAQQEREAAGADANKNQDSEEEEEGGHDPEGIVNKGLRWINQTLTMSATSMSLEAEASTSQLHASQANLKFKRKSMPLGSDFDDVSDAAATGGNSASLLGTMLSSQSRRRTLHHGGTPSTAGHRPASGRIGSGNSKRSLTRRSSSLGGGSNLRVTNRRASTGAQPLCLPGMTRDRDEQLRSAQLAKDAAALQAARADNFNRHDDGHDGPEEPMAVRRASGNLSGHLLDLLANEECHKEQGVGKGNVLGDAANATRRKSESLIEYLTRRTSDAGMGDMVGSAMSSASSIASRQGQTRRRSTTCRPGRRRSSLFASAVKALDHEIDAADYEEGGGY